MKKTLFIIVFGIFVLTSATPVYADPVYYGSTPNLDNSWQGLPVCNEAKPKAPVLYEPGNPALPQAKNPGEVRLQWTKVPEATGYNIYYGISSRNYIFSVPSLGDVDNYTVGHLENRIYYFAVQAKGSCAASELSNEWAARPVGFGGFLYNFFNTSQNGSLQNQGQEFNQPQPSVNQQQAPLAKPKVAVPKTTALSGFQAFWQSIMAFILSIWQSIMSFLAKLFGR